MPLAADRLLDAADRRMIAGEDRLTEILAAVLQHDRQLATWFCERLDVSIPLQGRYEVSTQVWLNDELRPDMRIAIWDENGAPLATVWSEHKTGTDFHGGQDAEYSRVSGSQRWIALVPTSRHVPPGPQWRRVTWDALAQELNWIASNELVEGHPMGPAWRTVARRPDVPARLRVYDEFLAYLERSSVEVESHSRIEDLDVFAYGRQREARVRVEQLFRAACGGLPSELRRKQEVQPRTGHGDSWFIELELASWADMADPLEWWNAEFLVSPTDSWCPDPYNQPAFGAGLSFGARRKRVVWPSVLDPELSDWPRQLTQQGITLGETLDRVGRCFRTLYLSQVMGMGRTLTDQAAALAEWAERAVREIAGLEPPDLGRAQTS